MRDLETCKAEIFRRSENRIKERARQHRRALTLCVPLVLCLVIGAVTAPVLLRDGKGVAPTAQPERMETAPQAYEFSSADDASMLLQSYAPSETSDIRKQAPNQIPDGIDAAAPPKENEIVDEDFEGAVIANPMPDEHRVVVTTPEGEVVYVLSGDLLRCETEGWERRLTEKEAEELYQALDMPAEDGR